MIVLCFSMQGKDTFEHTHDKSQLFTFSMQERDILDHTNAKCHLCIL